MLKINKKNIIFCLGLGLLGFFAYQHWTKAEVATQLISTNETVTADSVGDETLQILSELRTLTLDEDIFTDKAFQSLEDFSMEIKEQPVGRNNPFAPLGEDGPYSNAEALSTSTSKTE